MRGVILFSVLSLIAAAGSIPFLFESPSIYYKFGIAKTLLRSGKVIGLAAAMLMFLQTLLISRIRFIDRVFSLNLTSHAHRINGALIGVVVIIHPLMILAAENFTFYPFEKKYWPEYTGICLLLFVAGLVVVSRYRSLLGLAYHKWLRLHRLATPLVIATMMLHILFVSDSFGGGFPRLFITAAALMSFLVIGRFWLRRLFPGRPQFVVSDVTLTGRDAVAVQLRPCFFPAPNYLPGQFAFIKPVSPKIPREEHPFTIASSPTRPETWQFVIRSLGDWTPRISLLAPGDPVYVDGPYGQFSHVMLPGTDPILMIAGGIGITPMLSMLRYMADLKDNRKVLLIWSNQNQARRVLPGMISSLRDRLPQLKVIEILTRSEPVAGDIRRLTPETLANMLTGFSRKAHAFVCGPPAMVKTVAPALKRIGFSPARVYKETFQL